MTTVARVGQSLHLTVVAEGGEIGEQPNLLSELGCDAVQGFLYARALSPSAFGRWLEMLKRIGHGLSPQAGVVSAGLSAAKRAG